MNKKLLRILWMDDDRIRQWGRWYVVIYLASAAFIIVASPILYFAIRAGGTNVRSGATDWLVHLAGHLDPSSKEYDHIIQMMPVVSDVLSKSVVIGILFSLLLFALGASFLVIAILLQRLRELISENVEDTSLSPGEER